jgi:hypothetical protein
MQTLKFWRIILFFVMLIEATLAGLTIWQTSLCHDFDSCGKLILPTRVKLLFLLLVLSFQIVLFSFHRLHSLKSNPS